MDHGSANVGTTSSLPGEEVEDFFDKISEKMMSGHGRGGGITKIHLSFLISRLLACWFSNMSLCHSMIHLYRDPGFGLSVQPEL